MKDHGTLEYDRTCWTATSVRRHEQQGYLPLFWQYAKAYSRHYLFGSDIEDEYFPSSDDITSNDVYESPPPE